MVSRVARLFCSIFFILFFYARLITSNTYIYSYYFSTNAYFAYNVRRVPSRKCKKVGENTYFASILLKSLKMMNEEGWINSDDEVGCAVILAYSCETNHLAYPE